MHIACLAILSTLWGCSTMYYNVQFTCSTMYNAQCITMYNSHAAQCTMHIAVQYTMHKVVKCGTVAGEVHIACLAILSTLGRCCTM